MEPILSILVPMILVVIGYTIGSTKIVNQGNEALVERLGQYNKKLKPGLNYIIPFIDKIAVEETTREQVLDTEPQQAITKDNISVEVDAIVYWRIKNLEKAYYAVEDVEVALENLVLTTLRSMIGEMELNQTYSSRNDINRSLLHQLAEPTAGWGVELVRVEVQNITPPRTVMESLELERAAESQKQAKISEAQGTVESIEIISKALQSQPNSKTVLQYLVTQRYVDANQKLSESPNSKVVFMDPKAITEAMTNLMDIPEAPDGGMVNNSSSSRNQ
jgi:regulator of protease activity HflC (stomatin/prohibitin superfamily)